MSNLEVHFHEIGVLDRIAAGDTFVHRLDPRSKLLATLLFIVGVVSFGKYEVSALLPFFLYPVVMAAASGMPAGLLGRKLLIVAPFALLVGILNPFLDREILTAIGPVPVSGGWISFTSIVFRFMLTVSAALLLVGTTGIHGVCFACEKLGMPRVFAVQLLLLYRYLFVLADEGIRMFRARSARSFSGRAPGPGLYAQMIGTLLLRAIARAQRIYLAMSCRGFDGAFRSRTPVGWHVRDTAFLLVWAAFFTVARCVNIPEIIGSMFVQ
ncbi:MAG: cobalt ECF transporter T component CbiQ [Verrucomicrobia bacterium]|nr:cobalt ECF transporter T component CbiQ [Verrucomicrobiota bacterium]